MCPGFRQCIRGSRHRQRSGSVTYVRRRTDHARAEGRRSQLDRPPRIGPGFNEDGRPRARGAPSVLALSHGPAFPAIERADAVHT